jgi:hypothetical protein
MAKRISNGLQVCIPRGDCELYGRNGYSNLGAIEIRRDDFPVEQCRQVVFEIFPARRKENSGAPAMLFLTLEGAFDLHKALGRILNPTKKDLE